MIGRMVRFAACRGCGAVFAAGVLDAMDTETSLQFEAYRREGHTVDDVRGSVTLESCRCAERLAYLERVADQATRRFRLNENNGRPFFDTGTAHYYSTEPDPDLARYLQEKQNG